MQKNNDHACSSVSVQNLIKTYDKGKVLAVDKVSFDVKAGELFGLIGADGAGKSSIFRILTTVLLADSGTATLAGFDVVKDYREITKQGGVYAGKIFTLPGSDCTGEPGIFCHRFWNNHRSKYGSDQRNL